MEVHPSQSSVHPVSNSPWARAIGGCSAPVEKLLMQHTRLLVIVIVLVTREQPLALPRTTNLNWATQSNQSMTEALHPGKPDSIAEQRHAG